MTNPARVYAEIRRSITDEFIYRVSGVMLPHAGEDKAISKEAIAAELGYEYSSSIKRRLEIAFEKLCELGFPVMATSTRTGYFMPVTDAEFLSWEAEHDARLKSEERKLILIRTLRLRYLAGDQPARPEPVTQRGLW